jgi:hypothetical protein
MACVCHAYSHLERYCYVGYVDVSPGLAVENTAETHER